jgi:acetyl-CoA carboxylase biotin carboxyl carrier protein
METRAATERMTLDEIKQLIDLTNASGIAELEVERGGNRVRIRRAVPGGAPQEFVLHGPAHGQAVTSGGHATAAAAAAPATAPLEDTSLVLVKSPIVGTFYESPSPDLPSFVKVGDTVHMGQVLCIIESMKLMNEIEAEVSGVVVAKLVENAKPVEYGEALFSIRPL